MQMNEGLVVAVRSIIGFFSLLIFARVLGKQQLSQLTFFEYVLGITIGSTASTLSTDLSTRAWPHWVALISWAVLGYIMQLITLKQRTMAKYIDGEPTIVIVNGKIMEEALKTMKYRAADILQLLRNKDIFDLKQVKFALIEPNGQISVLKKEEYQPVTPKDMNVSPSPSDITIEIIYDGLIIEKNLKWFNKDQKWLKKELKKRNIKDPSEVFLATLDNTGNFYVDKYNDSIKNENSTRDGTYKGPL
ncbi:Uncharacterized membrane protein YcaP, DUF421 family [Clostridium cochlearium]|uniref:Membrane-associated protein n=2 Tax=Clostridium cochlearium TaxID=1494 RepID=A0A239Z694_CLOCO|nr:Uncharacterized membrane protein YcaP, DUF421 family [Clostridium cochlearium]SNV66064.1 membrane-associated protein [Clostridium cochlearium]SQB34231.1 membrane-associated protein [Clostridium cochlearium]STA91531.1 membrane-associated protein [Clostridium cochlearium]